MKYLVQRSGNHIHLSDADLARLPRPLTPKAELTVAGEFVANERATVILDSGKQFEVAVLMGSSRPESVAEVDPADTEVDTPYGMSPHNGPLAWLAVSILGVDFRILNYEQYPHVHLEGEQIMGSKLSFSPDIHMVLRVKHHALNREALPETAKDVDGVVHLSPRDYTRFFGETRDIITIRAD